MNIRKLMIYVYKYYKYNWYISINTIDINDKYLTLENHNVTTQFKYHRLILLNRVAIINTKNTNQQYQTKEQLKSCGIRDYFTIVFL